MWTRGAYQDINLTIKHILRLLEIVMRGSLRPSLDLIEPRGEMRGGFSRLGADRVEVGRSCVLALRKRDVLMAGAFDDGKWDERAGHLTR